MGGLSDEGLENDRILFRRRGALTDATLVEAAVASVKPVGVGPPDSARGGVGVFEQFMRPKGFTQAGPSRAGSMMRPGSCRRRGSGEALAPCVHRPLRASGPGRHPAATHLDSYSSCQ
jgi:hypothetical protein